MSKIASSITALVCNRWAPPGVKLYINILPHILFTCIIINQSFKTDGRWSKFLPRIHKVLYCKTKQKHDVQTGVVWPSQRCALSSEAIQRERTFFYNFWGTVRCMWTPILQVIKEERTFFYNLWWTVRFMWTPILECLLQWLSLQHTSLWPRLLALC